jgi:Ca2+-binding EF-hand superfamily protein
MKKAISALAVALLCGAPAGAQPGNSGFDSGPRGPDQAQRSRDGESEGPGGRRDRGRGPVNLMFEAIDTNGDQVISKMELRKSIKALQHLDADGDGAITLAEASPQRGPGGGGRPGGSDPQAFVDRFMENDKNGDGNLTPDEVPERAMRQLQGGDKNGDGAIDKTELAEIAENMGGRGGGRPGDGGRAGRGQRGGRPGGESGRRQRPESE